MGCDIEYNIWPCIISRNLLINICTAVKLYRNIIRPLQSIASQQLHNQDIIEKNCCYSTLKYFSFITQRFCEKKPVKKLTAYVVWCWGCDSPHIPHVPHVASRLLCTHNSALTSWTWLKLSDFYLWRPHNHHQSHHNSASFIFKWKIRLATAPSLPTQTSKEPNDDTWLVSEG